MPHEYTRSTQRINAQVGGEFVIALDANPTTGYQWEPAFDAGVLTLLALEPPAPGAGIGAGGLARWRFKGASAGTTRLVMACRRPWEAAPVETLTYEVTVA